jgi:DNA anti-recombination protein RmuC
MKHILTIIAALVAAPAFGQQYRQDSTEYANMIQAENARRMAEQQALETQRQMLEVQRDQLHEMERQRRDREWERSRKQGYGWPSLPQRNW